MITDMQKQVAIGGLVGLLACAATYMLLGGKREEIVALEANIATLSQEVEKGRQLKSNYAKLKAEVDLQNSQLEELIRIMPTELDRGELPIRLKKVADTSGLEQERFRALPAIVPPDNSKEGVFYTEYPFEFKYRAGFHQFGRFASYVSGFEKMVNIVRFKMTRFNNTLYPAEINCVVSGFVYNPGPSKGKAAAKAAAAPAPATAKTVGD